MAFCDLFITILGLWNHVFLFSNLSLFVLLPFSYLFAESSGFFGHRKGIISRAYETFTVFSLLAVVVLGITYVVSAVIYPEKRGLQTLLSKHFVIKQTKKQFIISHKLIFGSQFSDLGSYHLPFLYSCVSFLGVILLLGMSFPLHWNSNKNLKWILMNCSVHTVGLYSAVRSGWPSIG